MKLCVWHGCLSEARDLVHTVRRQLAVSCQIFCNFPSKKEMAPSHEAQISFSVDLASEL